MSTDEAASLVEPPIRRSMATRVTMILDAFMTGPEVLRLEDVTSMTDLSRSTAFRILSELVELQWLQHDAWGYRSGPRVESYLSGGQQHGHVRAAAASALNELNLNTGAVAHLSVLQGSFVRYLDKVGGAEAASIPSGVDSRRPVWSTVGGRALLAALPPEKVDDLVALHRKSVDVDALHRKLNRIRKRNGASLLDGTRCDLGISGVAAPIIGPNGAVAALSLATRRRLNLAGLIPVVTFAAQQLFPEGAKVGARRSIS